MTRNNKRAGPDSQTKQLQRFLVTILFLLLFFFFFFAHYRGKLGRTVENFLFSILFLFCFCFVNPLLSISRGIVVKSDKKLLTSLVWFPRFSYQTFLSLFFFFLFLHYCVKLGWIVENFSSLFFSSFFSFA